MDMLLDFQYMNDAGDSQVPIQSYGEEMVEYLREQSEKWDPEGMVGMGGYISEVAD